MIIIFSILCRISHIEHMNSTTKKMKYNSNIFLLSFLRSLCVFFSSSRCYCCYISRFDSTLSIGTTHIDELNVRVPVRKELREQEEREREKMRK